MQAAAAPQTLVRGRIALTAVFCAAAFALIGARLVDIVVLGGGDVANAGETKALSARADIVDRNGVLIARDLPVRDLYASPAAFEDTIAAADALADATGADAARLERAFAPRRGYVPVARALNPDQQNSVMQLGLPGLTFEDSYKRYYPSGRAAAHVIGQVDIDGHGISGLELGIDKQLRQNAVPVQLSLDMRIQYALAHEVEEGRNIFGAKAAGGIVMDVRTGEILALTSFPNFEPNERTLAAGDSSRNRMTQDVYELGSIFKIFSFAQAIEDHTVRLDETFKVGEPLKMGRFEIHDFEALGPTLTAAMVFADSSNIGTAQIGMRTPPAKQRDFLERLGLLSAAKTELPESASPLLPPHWGDIESTTISYGHGISVSALAFVAAAASVVNGGTRVMPTFLKRGTPQNGERLISERTSETMRELMRLVVTSGTGKQADVPGYDVGGKTGTAEKPENGRYAKHALISSFCGVFPISAPRYLVFVMLDEPKGTKNTDGFATAGYTSAPVAGRVIARIAPLLGMPQNEAIMAAEGRRESIKQP